MIDPRRERDHIWREYGIYQNQVGESVVWFMFDTGASQYNDTYDEGGRQYMPGINVPILWVDQIEAPEQMLPEGRRVVASLRFAVSAQAMAEVQIGAQEAHGHRLWDPGWINEVWFNDRLNDILYYDGRYWECANFQIRGRIQDDVIVGVSCTETYPEDEFPFDFPIVPAAVGAWFGKEFP